MIYKYEDHTPEIHETCFIAPGCSVIGQVVMDKGSSIWHNSVIRGDMASIYIGENTNIQDGSVLHCVKDKEIRIGKNVTVGHRAVLHSCQIDDESLIGMGAVILDGVKVGKNCLIGAGSVVVSGMKVPDKSLVMGNPARIRRMLTEEEIMHIRNNANEYVTLAFEHKKIMTTNINYNL